MFLDEPDQRKSGNTGALSLSLINGASAVRRSGDPYAPPFLWTKMDHNATWGSGVLQKIANELYESCSSSLLMRRSLGRGPGHAPLRPCRRGRAQSAAAAPSDLVEGAKPPCGAHAALAALSETSCAKKRDCKLEEMQWCTDRIESRAASCQQHVFHANQAWSGQDGRACE